MAIQLLRRRLNARNLSWSTRSNAAIVSDEVATTVRNSGPMTWRAAVENAAETERPLYWTRIPRWRGVTEQEFLSHRFQSRESITKRGIFDFLQQCLPDEVANHNKNPMTRDELVADIKAGMESANMAIRLTPHIASLIDWTAPLQCPIFRQFVGTGSGQMPDHQQLKLDSLHEENDSPVPGLLVHRYQDKALLLTTKTCPVYCRFCTRSYAVGERTPVNQKRRIKNGADELEQALRYLEQHPSIRDVVLSGGDTYHLAPDQLYSIGKRLLAIPHIRELRFASKGLAVSPSRFLDPQDSWAQALFEVSSHARRIDKEIAIHTHFNSAKEIAWTTRQAARALFQAGVTTVRNQSVLLRGVNDSFDTMSPLIRELADMHITPLYVYQADMVKGTEDLRTPLYLAIELENKLRGTIAGHRTPSFVVDLPGGGGKRPVSTYTSYDRRTGMSTWAAPGVKPGETFHYYDPVWSVEGWALRSSMDQM